MNVILLWHMHQPYYVNPMTKMAMMPWVRLHAARGYLDMVDLLDRVPDVQMNFNFTPVLVRQIEELASGSVSDLWEYWSRKPAAELHVDEKKRLLENFFKINWDTCVKPYPRYQELLHRRGTQWSERSIQEAVGHFSEADFRDLQTWYNLAWCGFAAQKHFPILKELRQQGGGFTEEQKLAVLDTHKAILKMVLGLYRKTQDRGQIELTTTPFFHPISPLIYDTDLARRCQPHAHLPPRFEAPEDLAAQLRLAQEQHERVFGKRATGLWPSEGSVAPEVVPLFAEAGIQYFCSDEGNLFRSLEQDPHWRGRHIDHLELFQPWRVWHNGAQVQALFRERPLSDFIGFNAARNEAEKSAHYLLEKLDHLNTVAPAPHQVVLLALDGENAWEAFPDSGEKFLTLFYEGLARRPHLRTRRLADYFVEYPAIAPINNLHTGSWINSDFDVWIGDSEENKAWDWLGRTRRFLVETLAKETVDPTTAKAAWWEIYAAEGSDWFWWYGPDFDTDSDFLFDELFRTHLQNVYRLLGHKPPAYLDVPICLEHLQPPYSLPHHYIKPGRDGYVRHYYEWVGAGELNVAQQQTAMFQADRLGQRLLYGVSRDEFYLRFDMRKRPEHVVVQFTSPHTFRLEIRHYTDKGWEARLEKATGAVSFKLVPENITVSWGQFLFVAVPLRALQWNEPGQVSFFLQLLAQEIQVERYPERGTINFPVPEADFEARNWFV
jgi:alpha-amylase/alpha-mannosidase (GH57 family)